MIIRSHCQVDSVSRSPTGEGLQFLHEILFNSRLTGEICYGRGGFVGVEIFLLGMDKPPFVAVKAVRFHTRIVRA